MEPIADYTKLDESNSAKKHALRAKASFYLTKACRWVHTLMASTMIRIPCATFAF